MYLNSRHTLKLKGRFANKGADAAVHILHGKKAHSPESGGLLKDPATPAGSRMTYFVQDKDTFLLGIE